MASIHEIAPDIFRLSIYVPQIDLQFNHFLVRDAQPLLYHSGMRRFFPDLREAVAKLIDPATLRWVGFSHFEVDECGALNDWHAAAPQSRAVCTQVGAMVNLGDFAVREPNPMGPGDVLVTGARRFCLIPTPHLPHGWDASVMFEETTRTLLCSDLFHQVGDVEATTTADVLGRFESAIRAYQAHPVLMDYMPYTPITRRLLYALADLNPGTLAAMHGSTYTGNCQQLLRDADDVMRRTLGRGTEMAAG